MWGGHHPEGRSQACRTWELTEADRRPAGGHTSRVLGKGSSVQSSRVVQQSTPDPQPCCTEPWPAPLMSVWGFLGCCNKDSAGRAAYPRSYSSQFWRPEVRDQGANRWGEPPAAVRTAVPHGGLLGREGSRSSVGFRVRAAIPFLGASKRKPLC